MNVQETGIANFWSVILLAPLLGDPERGSLLLRTVSTVRYGPGAW